LGQALHQIKEIAVEQRLMWFAMGLTKDIGEMGFVPAKDLQRCGIERK
jgi:hypothetical protein